MTKAYKELLSSLKACKIESKKQQDHAFKILNGQNNDLKQPIKDALNEQIILLSDMQNQQGFDWLMLLWKTPKGKEKDSNPFGYREQEILENFSHLELRGYYYASNWGRAHHVPLYKCISKEGASFEYYMWDGKIHIVG